MHIAIYIERFDPDAGGNERSTAQIAEALVDRGHKVTVVTGSMPRWVRPDRIAVEALSSKASSSATRLMRYARFAKAREEAGGFDVGLSVTMAVPAPVLQPRGGTVRETLERNIALRGTPMKRLGKRIGIALDPKQRLLLAMEKRTLADPRVRRIVAVSRYVQEQLATHYDVDSERIEIIPNASVMPAVSEEQRDAWRSALRSSYGIGDDATAFLFAATNPRLKGFATLIHAGADLVKRGLNPVLLLAGCYGYGHQQWVADMGLREHVRWVGQTRSMPRLFTAADVTVLPTFYDPSSKVVLESLMMGVPAISTACNGASDFIQPEDGAIRGRVVSDPADAAELAAAMADLSDPRQRGACREAIAPDMAAQLSMSQHVDRLEAVLHEAAQQPPETPETPETAPETAPESAGKS